MKGKKNTKEAFLERTAKSPDSDCIVWKGVVLDKGYGQFWWSGRRMLAHRLAYTLTRGPIPPGLTIDHLCRNRACVNPDHLQAVTRGENTLRGMGPTAQNKRKNVCDSGHQLSGPNLYIRPDGDRACRACQRERSRKYKQRKRDALRTLSTPESEAVDDGHSQTDKCGPDCTLEVLRPGQVQCNRDGMNCPNKEASDARS